MTNRIKGRHSERTSARPFHDKLVNPNQSFRKKIKKRTHDTGVFVDRQTEQKGKSN